ncbi:MAG: helix-turn-helix transcriptional regulator [Clostridia bacterium]|nr:helix-turn-helix transcriptional regulator [Clostridia bacterium]
MNYLPPIMFRDELQKVPITSSCGSYYYGVERDTEDSILCVRYASPIHAPLQMHQAPEFMYVEQGEVQAEIDGKSYTVGANQMTAISSFTMHAYRAEQGAVTKLLSFPRQYIPGFQKILSKKVFDSPVCTDDEGHSLRALIHCIDNISHSRGIYEAVTPCEETQLLTPLLHTFLHTVIRQCGLRDNSQASPLFVSAIEYIHTHYHRPIRIPEMARALLCEQHTLSDQFREAFGITITAYTNRLRAIELHAILSKDASLTLAEAAGTVGFGSMRSMLRAYREVYGCTPTANR